MSLLGRARLLRWLGPWTSPDAVPGGIVRREIEVPAPRPFRAWIWRRDDERPTGSLLLVPGLHFLGPADPRFDRFGRILASAGNLVLAPFLPDFERLVVGRGVISDTERAFDALLALPDRPAGRPSVFSISFGSMPALRLAAQRPEALRSLLVFGGFADFRRTLRFALTGDRGSTHDPLNAPVVFINVIDHLGVDDPHDRDTLCRAWRLQCERTWGREENKKPEAYRAVAHAIARELPPHLRELFLIGARAHPAGERKTLERALEALERAGTSFDWIDPRPFLGTLRCEVHLIHGRNDDVIPYEESVALARALPSHVRVELHLTGLYGHTGAVGLRSLVGGLASVAEQARAAVREIRTLLHILDAMATSLQP